MNNQASDAGSAIEETSVVIEDESGEANTTITEETSTDQVQDTPSTSASTTASPASPAAEDLCHLPADRLDVDRALAAAGHDGVDAFVGGLRYYDARTDDARFVTALARTAAREGAAIATSTRAVDMLREGDRVTGVEAVKGGWRINLDDEERNLLLRLMTELHALITGPEDNELLRRLFPVAYPDDGPEQLGAVAREFGYSFPVLFDEDPYEVFKRNIYMHIFHEPDPGDLIDNWGLPADRLLAEGLGDTVRVSLTEDPVAEIPVARELVRKAVAPDSPVRGPIDEATQGTDQNRGI